MISIIPAIDIMDGQCVRLSKGDFKSRKTYFDDPLEVARMFEDAGIRRLHVVDLDGAKKKAVVNWKTLERLSEGSALSIDFGGGIQSEEELERAFDIGIAQVTIGSMAVKNPVLIAKWLKQFGTGRIIIAADFRDGMIAVSGWQEQTELSVDDYIRDKYEQGFKTFLCTDISRDGMLKGPAYTVYERLKKTIPEIEVLASGGVSSIEDVKKLNEMQVDGVIIGKAFYENKITLTQMEPFIC